MGRQGVAQNYGSPDDVQLYVRLVEEILRGLPSDDRRQGWAITYLPKTAGMLLLGASWVAVSR